MIFWNYGFYSIVQNNLSEKSSHAIFGGPFSALNSWDMGFWSSNCFILNLVLVPEVRNTLSIREVSMGLCKTANVSILTFICPRSYSSCVYLMMRSKVSNGKFAKWWHHTLQLYINWKSFICSLRWSSDLSKAQGSRFVLWDESLLCLTA